MKVAPELMLSWPIIRRTIAACLITAFLAAPAPAQTDSPAFAKFKLKMMPKVGQKITVVGTWSDRSKQCCWLAFDDWGAYLYAAKASGVARERNLFAHFHNGQTVKLTGTLRYFPKPVVTKKYVQYPPEHFFFDATEVEMSPGPGPAIEDCPRSGVTLYSDQWFDIHLVIDDEAAKGVKASLYSRGKLLRSFVSDEDGHFRSDSLPEGTYLLVLSSEEELDVEVRPEKSGLHGPLVTWHLFRKRPELSSHTCPVLAVKN